MGKCHDSLGRWGSPEVTVMEEGSLGRGELGDVGWSAQAAALKGEKH